MGQTDQAEGANLIDRIRTALPHLSPSLRAIADMLLIERSGLDKLSLTQLAQLTFTSKPTVVRFAQEFGYTGWKDFREAFIRDSKCDEAQVSADGNVDFNYPFGVTDQPKHILGSIALTHQRTAEVVAKSLAVDELVRAARTLLDARTVLFMGNTPNLYLGEIFSFNVIELGIDCRVPHEERMEQEARFIKRGDCALVVPYSGDLTRGGLKYLPLIKAAGASTIAITREGSKLASVCDYALTYPALEHYYSKIAGYYGVEAVATVLDALHAFCYAAHYEDNDSARRANARIWQLRDHASDTF